jgi:DNA-directed RNA polymerase subunit RPC12/RpoP
MQDIHYECTKCGQHIDAPEELAGQLVECPTCKEMIEVPIRSQRKEAPKPVATPAPARGQNPLCRTCGEGALVKRAKWRMSVPVVVIGFILLIPSILGMLFGVLMLVLGGVGMSAASQSGDYEVRTNLVAHQIPDTIITNIVAGKIVAPDQLAPLTVDQRAAVQDAQSSVSAQKIGLGAGTAVLGGFSIFVIVVSFVGGLIGWLLVMRKRVLECARCGAVVPAS